MYASFCICTCNTISERPTTKFLISRSHDYRKTCAHIHKHFMMQRSLCLYLRSEVGHVDSMMECLLQSDRYLITAIDPAEQPYFPA